IEEGVGLAGVRNQRQAKLGGEPMNDGVGTMDELRAEFDGMPRERAPREDAPAEPIARLEADGGSRALHKFARRKHPRRPGADDNNLRPIRQPPRAFHMRMS